MPKTLTKREFETMFREEVLPHVVQRYGLHDKPARREAWNDAVDAYIRDRALPEAAGNWAHPRWLETWSPPQEHHATRATGAATKSHAQLDREVAAILSGSTGHAHAATITKTKTAKHDLKVGDAVQFRWEPGTGGVIRSFETDASDDQHCARVATPRGERRVPASGLVRVRKEHEARVRRSSTSTHATKRVAKTRVLYVVQGNYGYGDGWEDVTAEEDRKEARDRIREYRENESAPFRLIKRRERIAP